MMTISCQEILPEQDWSEPNSNKITFKVTIPSENGSKRIWPAGSRIGVFCEQVGAQNVPVEISSSTATTEEAVFYSNLEWTEGKLTEGNALIAVYDDADAAGNILWSWHIWVTDDDLDANIQTWPAHPSLSEYDAYQNLHLMDHNLGALSNSSWKNANSNLDHGLYYQWRRKDPFINADDSKFGSIVFRQTYDCNDQPIEGFGPKESQAYSNEVKWIYVYRKHLTVEQLGAYPMAFYWSGTTGNNQFWMNTIRHDLWGAPRCAEEENTLGHKTIYDPCPAGYRVMSHYALSGVTSSIGGGKYDNAEIAFDNIVNGKTFNANKEALQVKAKDGSIVRFPATGFIDFAKYMRPTFLQRMGSYGYMWSNKMSGSDDNVRAYRFQFDKASFTTMANGYASYGHQVRCENIK